jgi:outer membrane lipoprotein-sorting protein
MIIKGPRGARSMTSKSWGEGLDKTLTVYLSPARDKDTKMLKLSDELWIWSPATDRTIKIAGHMLRQSMMGSDVSYEDFMQDPVLANTYDVAVAPEETISDTACYVLTLTAKKNKTPAYNSRKLWVDKQKFLPIKQELYAKSGKLLKRFTIDDSTSFSGRWYPKKMTFKDVLKTGDGTQITIDSIEFDIEIPAYMFTKASLKK